MLTTLLYLLLAYLLYRFTFGFLIPIVNTARQVRHQFKEVKERMAAANQNPSDKFGKQSGSEQAPKPGYPEGEYIPFEELK